MKMQDEYCHAIVLMNLGSPDSTNVSDVKKYLVNFLMDEKVIDYPYILRWLLVRGIIVPFRAPKSAHAYKSVWTDEGSPLIALSNKLKDEVHKQTGVPTEIMMRYGNPSPKYVFDKLQDLYPDLRNVLLIPMYPHYAMSSYETAVAQALVEYRNGGYTFDVDVIKPYYNNGLYINALSESIAPYLSDPFDHILFSYHGVPERHIYKGDITGNHCLKNGQCCEGESNAHSRCYRHQCYSTTALVVNRLNLSIDKYSQSFQSRLGREEWLKPYTAEILAELPSRGVKKLLVVCPAFVTDCLETLEEIAVEGKRIFINAGGESFTMIPCLNIQPPWVDSITAWAKQYFSGNPEMIFK